MMAHDLLKDSRNHRAARRRNGRIIAAEARHVHTQRSLCLDHCPRSLAMQMISTPRFHLAQLVTRATQEPSA